MTASSTLWSSWMEPGACWAPDGWTWARKSRSNAAFGLISGGMGVVGELQERWLP